MNWLDLMEQHDPAYPNTAMTCFCGCGASDWGDKCPHCGAPIIDLWSGVKCSKCDWWFCL